MAALQGANSSTQDTVSFSLLDTPGPNEAGPLPARLLQFRCPLGSKCSPPGVTAAYEMPHRLEVTWDVPGLLLVSCLD